MGKTGKNKYTERFLRREWLKGSYIARKTGINKHTLSRKVNNKNDWTKEERQAMVEAARQIQLETNEFLNNVDGDF